MVGMFSLDSYSRRVLFRQDWDAQIVLSVAKNTTLLRQVAQQYRLVPLAPALRDGSCACNRWNEEGHAPLHPLCGAEDATSATQHAMNIAINLPGLEWGLVRNDGSIEELDWRNPPPLRPTVQEQMAARGMIPVG